MELSRAVSVLSFLGALVIGVAVGYVSHDRGEILAVDPPIALTPKPFIQSVPEPSVKVVQVRAQDLRGHWIGTWGYGRESCAIEIKRIDGNKFYGTLRKEGAEIAIAGELDPDERSVFFHETKVLKLGPHMSGWSLGTNAGSFSPDGRRLTGTGTDKWGSYGWDASKN